VNPVVLLLGEVTVVFAVALLGTLLASRARAALRHLILASAFGVALILPLATLVSPTITVEIAALPEREPDPFATHLVLPPVVAPVETIPLSVESSSLATPSTATPVSSIPPTTWLLLTWAVVALAALLPVIAGLWHLRGIRRRSHPWAKGAARALQLMQPDSRRAIVLLNEQIAAPITGGLVQPAIALPADAVGWSDTHLANALLHELEHVRRYDWAVHLAARAVCALYWFHPLAWIAWKALRLEAERACDDAVLAREDAGDYAEQLLELARRLSGKPALPGLQMAGDSSLSSRIKAVLDNSRPRGRTGWMALACIVVAATIVVAVFAPLRPIGPVRKTQQEALSHPPASPVAPIEPSPTEALITPPQLSFQSDTPLRFSGVRISGGEDPHAYGPRVELCGKGSQWTGFIALYTGSVADPPTASLEPLLLDESTGIVSFTAQLTVGVEASPDGKVPARRLYQFSGHVDEKVLSGTLTEKPIKLGTFKAVSEKVVLDRETPIPMVAMSCDEWAENYRGRAGSRDKAHSPAALSRSATTAPAIQAGASAASPREVVSNILDLIQSALADDVTGKLDDIERPITGLHHVQRHARAVLNDDGSSPAALAAHYVEIVNALATTANSAVTVAGRRPDLRLPTEKFQQLAAALRSKSAELAAVVMPTSDIRLNVTTPEQRAALTALELARAARREPRFSPSWLPTHLNTLERAAQSLASDDGATPGATTMKISLLTSALRVATRQANEIAGRATVVGDVRRKAAELAISLNGVGEQLDGRNASAGLSAGIDWLVTSRSVGPLPIGASISDVRSIIGDPAAYLIQALHQDHALAREPENSSCAYLVSSKVPAQVGLMFQKGRLARVDVYKSGIRTTGGAEVGNSESRILDLYGSRISVKQHHYPPAGAHYMTFTPADNADRDFQMLFETDGAKVTQFRIGLRAAVEQVEGCG
jgi:beta-lactamase regulating signal transducer with metallopeptidase domain